MAVKTTLKLIMTISFLCLFSIEPSLAAGDSNKPTQSPSSEKPKKEDSSKPTAATATEVQPSIAARPVESKAAESKPTNEAKPPESKKSPEAINSKGPKPDVKASSKPDSKSTKKPASQSSKSNRGENGKGNGKEGNAKDQSTKGDKGLGEGKKDEKVDGSSPVPSSGTSKNSPSAIAADDPTQSNSAELLPESFVRIEKSEGNRAVLVVSGQKIGSTIKITITPKGPNK